jgi:predicted RNA polymerase sigma factor
MRNARIKISFGVRPRTPHLEECGRCEDAIASYDRTIVLEPDEAAKDFLKDRLRAPR